MIYKHMKFSVVFITSNMYLLHINFHRNWNYISNFWRGLEIYFDKMKIKFTAHFFLKWFIFKSIFLSLHSLIFPPSLPSLLYSYTYTSNFYNPFVDDKNDNVIYICQTFFAKKEKPRNQNSVKYTKP
jgi:hypothetical protein